MNNSNDKKSASNDSVDKKVGDQNQVTSPQTESTAKSDPAETKEPAKNAQSPAQSSR